MNFWQTFRRAPINVAKWWQYQRFVALNKKQRYYIEIPAFSIATPVWLGSSYITTEFRLSGLNEAFTLQPQRLIPPTDVDFCLAVRYPTQNDDGLDVVRYKLWENVGERLVYPLYNGEIIQPNCTFEIWSTSDGDQTSLAVPYTIFLGILVQSNNYEMCCSRASNLLDVLSQHCSLFAVADGDGNYQLPIVFNTCFNDIVPPPADETFYRIIETGEIRNSSTGEDLRVWK